MTDLEQKNKILDKVSELNLLVTEAYALGLTVELDILEHNSMSGRAPVPVVIVKAVARPI
jgi:hypothetical protein